MLSEYVCGQQATQVLRRETEGTSCFRKNHRPMGLDLPFHSKKEIRI